jgi:TrmH family RNA methyltransferase
MFGRESSGLNNQELTHANIVVSIPTSHKYPSLNLSHAVAVILYELFLVQGVPTIIRELSTQKEKALLLQFISQITPYLHIPPYKERVLKNVFKNLIGRAILSRREANSLLGLFRRILVGLGMRKPIHDPTTVEVNDTIDK